MTTGPETVATPAADRRTRGLLMVLAGSLLWSTAGPFLKAVDHLDVWTIQTWRAVFGALSLIVIIVAEHGVRAPLAFRMGPLALAAVLLSAVSMVAYIGALKLTSVATVLIVYATLPFVAAGVAFLVLKERVERRTLVASGIALVGVAVIAGTAVRPQDLAGAALSFCMTLIFALLLVLARARPGIAMAPVNALAAILSAVVCHQLSPGILPAFGDLVLLALFGITTTGLAYLLYLTGGRDVPSAEAGLLALLDVVIGPLLVFAIFGIAPRPAEYAGGLLVLGALVWWLKADLKR